MTLNNDLYQRVRALSPSQRAALAKQLAQRELLQESQRLVAYVVPQAASEALDLSVCRDLLKAKLPNYMVPTAIVPLERLPRTANGKVDVNALPDPHLSVSESDGSTAPRTPVEVTLAQIWQAVLKLDTVGIHDNFFELGGDSILSIQIVSRARETGLWLTPNQLFDQPTIAELATAVNLTPEVTATQDLVTGPLPLTPIQHWFFEQEMEVPQHWHQAMLVELPADGGSVENALATLWAHHDALRMRFTNRQQINSDTAKPPSLVQIDLANLSESEQLKAIADHGSQLHANVTLDGGLMRAALFTRGTNRHWLLLSLHHLIVDAVSWQILLEDLSKLLTGVTQLPAKTTSFKIWAETLVAQTAARQLERTFWLSQIEQPAIALPRDHRSTPSPTEGTAATVTVALSEDDTQALLQVVPAVYNTQINDALLTALAQTLLQWVGLDSGNVRVELEAHGRESIAEGIDVSRTVGWFTTTYPVNLQISRAENCIETLKSVKEQLRQIPDRGIGYGMLRYLENNEAGLSQPSEVLFNYLGQQTHSTTDLQVIQDVDVGTLRDPRNQRSYLLDINAWVTAGQLQINWRYDTQIHRTETVTTLAHHYLGALKSLIAQCTAGDSGGFTPSDFPDADLDQAELDDFIGQLTEEI